MSRRFGDLLSRIFASIVYNLASFRTAVLQVGVIGPGGGKPDLCIERNRYGCVYGDYRRSAPDESLISTAKTAGYLARLGAIIHASHQEGM